MMENAVLERINVFLKKNNITKKKFGKQVGIPEGTLKSMFNRGTNPSLEYLQKIAYEYRYLSLRWLLIGEGEMCLEELPSEKSSTSEIDYLNKEVEELKTKLKQAEYIIELQKRIIDGEDRAVKVNKNVG